MWLRRHFLSILITAVMCIIKISLKKKENNNWWRKKFISLYRISIMWWRIFYSIYSIYVHYTFIHYLFTKVGKILTVIFSKEAQSLPQIPGNLSWFAIPGGLIQDLMIETIKYSSSFCVNKYYRSRLGINESIENKVSSGLNMLFIYVLIHEVN